MAAKKKPRFMTSPTSPFPDKYDLEGEATVLQHLIDADDPDPMDPLFPRFAEYEDRLKQKRAMDAASRPRPTEKSAIAAQVQAIGMLQAGEEDIMTIHTRDAMRLFVGRPGDDASRPIAGGRRVAASLRQLWALSGNDNPFADWMLVKFDEAARTARQKLEQHTQQAKTRLESMREKGLTYSVLKSKSPEQVGLGFASPYGFAVATTVVEFDWLSRWIKSAQRRDLLSSNEAHEILFQTKRDCRAVFEPVVRASGLLMREELRPLTRADFFSDADEAKKRVTAVQALFGNCPKDIFIGERTPRHTRRSVSLSDAELKLLESVPVADDLTSGADQSSELIE